MLDSYLFEMEKEKINYIMEHKDQSAQNLNEFFSPEYFNEKDFEIYNSDFLIDINSMRETIENRIRFCNKTFGVNWQLKDTYSELKVLNDSVILSISLDTFSTQNPKLLGNQLFEMGQISMKRSGMDICPISGVA